MRLHSSLLQIELCHRQLLIITFGHCEPIQLCLLYGSWSHVVPCLAFMNLGVRRSDDAEETTGCSALASLAARATSGELPALQAQPTALTLCLPGFTTILLSTLNHLTQAPQATPADRRHHATDPGTSLPIKGHSAVVQHWCAVVKVLVDMLSSRQLEEQLLPLLTRPFTLQHSAATAAICIALLHIMPLLFDRLDLDLYLTRFHPHIMHMVVTSANQPLTAGNQASHGATPAQIAASFERAQLTNASSTALCGVVSSKLPLPVVLEHVIRPLLLALGNSPDVAVALIGVGSAMGGAMAALHLLPSLIMVLISSSVNGQTAAASHDRMPARRRLSESRCSFWLLTKCPVTL